METNMETNTNNQNTLNFIKILELIEYCKDKLHINILDRLSLSDFEGKPDSTIIDLLIKVVDLHKQKDYFDFRIFDVDTTTITINKDINERVVLEYVLDIDNYLDNLSELYLELRFIG